LSGNTVTVIRRELEARDEIEHPTERVGRGGYVYRELERQLGQLPNEGVLETLGNVATRVLSGPERIRQRQIVGYLQRVTTAIADQYALPVWKDREEAAKALEAVLSPDKVRDLVLRLGDGTQNLQDVVLMFDYWPAIDDD
jgi:hypothetical protein